MSDDEGVHSAGYADIREDLMVSNVCVCSRAAIVFSRMPRGKLESVHELVSAIMIITELYD